MYNKNVYKYDDMKRREHMAVRQTAGWFLFTHELLEVSGSDATAFLDYIYPKNIGTLGLGRARYTTMLNDEATITDDVIVLRLEENLYWISTLYTRKILPWFEAHKEGYDVTFTNITKQWDMYSVQGPKSLEILNEILDEPIDSLKFFQIADNSMGGTPVKVHKSGFTGEKLGYELYIGSADTKLAVSKLREVCPKYDALQVTEIQIMVWTLATEAGYYLMCDLARTNPYEVGMERGINFGKNFVGKEALEAIRDAGAARHLYGFTVDEDDIFISGRNMGGPGSIVEVDGEEVGRVTKITYSYVLEKNIGYALVDVGKAQAGDKVMIHGYEAVLCDTPFI